MLGFESMLRVSPEEVRASNFVALLELTWSLNSTQVLEAARDREEEYLQILSKLDRLGIPSTYDTLEMSVLGHYFPSTLTCHHYISQLIFSTKVCQSLNVENYLIKQHDFRFPLQRIFLSRTCMEWTHN